MKLFTNNCCACRYIRSDCDKEVSNLKKTIRQSISNDSINMLANVDWKIFNRFSLHYGFALGYKTGTEHRNNYQVIVSLFLLCDNSWHPIKYDLYRDYTWISRLRDVINNDAYGRRALASDIFYIYCRINIQHYSLIYNYDMTPLQIRHIERNITHVHLSNTLLKKIIYLSGHYPSKYCMGMWLEWLYLAMTAEYFPEHRINRNNVRYKWHSRTGKLVKAIAIVQCLYTNMGSNDIANFSRGKSSKRLLKLAKSCLKLWKFNIVRPEKNIILDINNDMINNPEKLNNYLLTQK